MTGANFENSLHAFGQTEKSLRDQCIIVNMTKLAESVTSLYLSTKLHGVIWIKDLSNGVRQS